MIEPPVLGFAGYATVPAPRDGFWRVSSWSQVFDPPPPPQPLGASPAQDDSGRYDDPAARLRTLYCATEPEGALGEHLGDFVLSTAAVVRIEAFLDSEPEPGFDEDYHRQLRAEDIKAFGWKLGRAPAREARLIDVEHWRTYLAAAPRAMPALGRYGIERFDRRTLLVLGVMGAAATRGGRCRDRGCDLQHPSATHDRGHARRGVPQTYESLLSDSLAVSRRPLFRTGRKIVRSMLLVLGPAAALIGGAFATFTDSVTAGPQAISSGTVKLATGPTNDVATGATNIAAGDTIAREADLNSTGATIAEREISPK
jgi:hypothetical protein